MATIEEGFCRDDSDCSKKQYCYDVSKTCVDYTQCQRYNRQENHDRRSRHPSQCGACLPGYTAEKLGTGEMAFLCRKTGTQLDVADVNKLGIYTIVFTTLGVLLLICLAFFIFILYKRRPSRRQGNNAVCDMVPTAPPLENRPFIDTEGASSPVPFNNNKILKDKNNLVRAAACTPPSWVRTNPHYENDSSNESMEAMEQLHSVVEFPTNNQSNSWTPEQPMLQIANGNLVGYEVEQVDNSLNAVLIQANNPSSSTAGEERCNSNNNNNNNNSSSGSTSESSNTQNSKERVRASNILISQKISMNVNLRNDDY